MTGAAIVLVLISAVAHATWNLLAKRATTPEVFTWWMTAAGSVIFTPVAIYYFVTDPPNAAGWGYIAATVALHTGYFFSLGRRTSTPTLVGLPRRQGPRHCPHPDPGHHDYWGNRDLAGRGRSRP